MNIYPRRIFSSLKLTLEDDRVVVLTGMRRVGKTTAARWLLNQMPTENKVYFDLERLDQRVLFQENNYEVIADALRNRGLDLAKFCCVAIDEIQYVPNIPSVVKYLYDTYRIKFILTGSSSFYIKNYFTESLAGRKTVFELFPLTFGELLAFRQIKIRERKNLSEMIFDRNEYDRLKSPYEEFIQFGGFPDVVLESSFEKKKIILNDILSSYFNIDVRTMTDFQKIAELQQILKVLAARIGSKIDNSKLATIVGISRPTLAQYLEFLEKTYLIKRLPAFTSSDRASAVSKKLYFYDNGIANTFSNIGEGALFENAIFTQLHHYGKLCYLASRDDEVDFILSTENKNIGLEVKTHPFSSDADRLKRLATKNGLQSSFLIGRNPSRDFLDFIWGGFLV